ncbi:MAG TPA: uracil phosphoribosyltransferase [Acidimicrobiales bacterium]|jgi:uracil phosphoribosyltransferase|nr:uracil phosphoribosyltransferase [Acidimicrobiales bacterium]
MQVTVVEHPLVAERLTRLRDKTTKRPEFRRNLEELTAFLVYEAMRNQPVVTIQIDTPLAPTTGVQVAEPPLLVPVMRAGLGMLHATMQILPNARVGFVGLRRDEETHLPHAYVNTVPEHLAGRRVLVLDPMLATGGSLIHTCNLLRDAGAGPLVVACMLAAPEGVRAFVDAGFDAELYTAAIDDRLNESAFIVPGLGDAGDRQFGLA